MKVMLVDDHAVVRMGFKLLLQACDDIEVVTEADSGEDEEGCAGAGRALRRVARAIPPREPDDRADVVLV